MLKIAERARDMAASSLGEQHPAYAIALQNLGIYYDAIENDGSKANEFLRRRARSSKRTIFRSRTAFIGSASFILRSATT
ncbi:MAG: hypothetical protein ABSC37_17370 [Xanthobacteraceae bacterium]